MIMMEPSVFRLNQEGYAEGLPVSVAVLSDEPVMLETAGVWIVAEYLTA